MLEAMHQNKYSFLIRSKSHFWLSHFFYTRNVEKSWKVEICNFNCVLISFVLNETKNFVCFVTKQNKTFIMLIQEFSDWCCSSHWIISIIMKTLWSLCYNIGLNCVKTTEPLQRDSLLLSLSPKEHQALIRSTAK